MFEDMLRAARKENSEKIKKYSNTPPPSPPTDAPKKWYEKWWGVGLALILFFPIGVILLLQNPRFSNGAKGGVMVTIIVLVSYCYFGNHETPPDRQDPAYVQSHSSQSSVATRNTNTEEKTIYASSQKSCLCIINAEDIDEFLDAGRRKDIEYIEGMIIRGKAFAIRRNTRVLCSDSGIYSGIVFVTFLEGEFTGQSAYTFAKRVQ